MNSTFRRTLMCGAIASALGFAGMAVAADTANAGGDTGNATPSTAQKSPSTSTTPSTSATGTSSTGKTSTDAATDAKGGSSTSTTGTTPGSAMPAERPAAAASTDSPARKIFDQLDSNHDGMLTFEEFARASFGAPPK